MDFFNMNFSELFAEKHGKQLFNDISNKILLENSNKNNPECIELVFKVAFFDYWGIDDTTTKRIIKDTMSIRDINVKAIKEVYKNSIKEIQQHLESTTNIKK